MPRKRPDDLKFDPLKALNKQYADDVKRRDELRREKELTARKEAELRSAWGQACEKFDLPSFRHLGDVLVRDDHKIWVDFLRILFSRDLLLAGIEGGDPDRLLDGNDASILALRLLTAACGESPLKLERELARIAEFHDPLRIQRHVGERLWIDVYEPVEEWQRHPTQPTPWITKAELTKAVQAKLEGFSKAGVLRQIEAGQLVIDHERPLNRQSTLCRFRHQDPTTHAVLLRCVINFLKNRDKLVSAKPWLSQLWEPI